VQSFGTAPPVATVQAIPLMAEQSKRMTAGFLAYWELLKQHATVVPPAP